MNLKNHTTPRYWELTGDRGEAPMYAHSTTYKWNLKDIPPFTRNMCNYVVGLLVFVTATLYFSHPEAGTAYFMDDQDVARGLFDSFEVQQTMFGTPVSPNHFLGKYASLFGFVANGMQAVSCQPVPIPDSTVPAKRTYSYFVPLSSLCGMKGHHTAQPACCYDRAQFILRTAASGVVNGLTVYQAGSLATNTIRVVAVVVPEPELRLGPGTSFMRYTQTASAAGTIVNVDALGNSTTLEGAEPGAGLAWLAWMGAGNHAFGGPGAVKDLEYLAAPFRDIQMIRNLNPFFLDWFGATGAGDIPVEDTNTGANYLNGGGYEVGYLYAPGIRPGAADLSDGAEFLPIITPHKFLETSKLQTVQGTQAISLKSSQSFSGEHVFAALQYHSWTPAKQEEVLRKLVDSGVARAVWGTNDLMPKLKVTNKQPAGSLNPNKTRFFAMTWEPKAQVSTPPTT